MAGHPYEVLKQVESSSRPGKFYEIRKSHQDGKTYCTCPGWIFKARKGDGICKHIHEYMQEDNHVEVVVYKLEEFLAVQRGGLILDDVKVKSNVKPDRGTI